jgi:hypothetical protein
MDTLPSGGTTSGGFRSVLAVSSFRLRARLDLSIPSASSGQRGCKPRFWIWRPSFERQRDFNPPEQRAAQRTLPVCRPFAPKLAFRLMGWSRASDQFEPGIFIVGQVAICNSPV